MTGQPLFEPSQGKLYTAAQLVVILCSTLSLYNALELLTLIFTTFRRYSGLYFYSLLVASLGLLPYNVGFLLEYFVLGPDYVGVIIDVPGLDYDGHWPECGAVLAPTPRAAEQEDTAGRALDDRRGRGGVPY